MGGCKELLAYCGSNVTADKAALICAFLSAKSRDTPSSSNSLLHSKFEVSTRMLVGIKLFCEVMPCPDVSKDHSAKLLTVQAMHVA